MSSIISREMLADGIINTEKMGTFSAEKITYGTIGAAKIAGERITYGSIDVARIPDLPTTKITSGTFAVERIPNLDAMKITSGTFATDRIPSISIPTYAARVWRNSNMSIPNAVPTAIIFNVEDRDDGNLWNDTNPTRLTAPVSGWYSIIGHIKWDSNTTGFRALAIVLTRMGTPLTIAMNMASSAAYVNMGHFVMTLCYLNTGDYVELVAIQNSGANRDIESFDQYSPVFTMIKI